MTISSDSKKDLTLRDGDAARVAGGRMTPIWKGIPAGAKHLLSRRRRPTRV
jgi:hypothetical protein